MFHLEIKIPILQVFIIIFDAEQSLLQISDYWLILEYLLIFLQNSGLHLRYGAI